MSFFLYTKGLTELGAGLSLRYHRQSEVFFKEYELCLLNSSLTIVEHYKYPAMRKFLHDVECSILLIKAVNCSAKPKGS